MFEYSTGASDARVNVETTEYALLHGETDVSFGDGDGSGGTDTINRSAGGLDIFKRHDFVYINSADTNNQTTAKVITASSTKLEVPAGTLTAAVVGQKVSVRRFTEFGTAAQMWRNFIIDLFEENRAASPDQAEPGTAVCRITLNGNSFVPGFSENGLNMGVKVGGFYYPVIDPETGQTEVWQGTPTKSCQIRSCIMYANPVTTGSSTTAIRATGVVSSVGGDITLSSGNSVEVGVPVTVTEFKFQFGTMTVSA